MNSSSSVPVLSTKLYVPPPRPGVVLRPRPIERLDEYLHGKLILLSAPAGFGKTTLVSEWVAACEGHGPPAAWLSLDEGDNELSRFLAYLFSSSCPMSPLSLPSGSGSWSKASLKPGREARSRKQNLL